ncbi:hypothetical protein BU17DRAFT_96532 [Hysterangium stoloniferum]|nr:hypothetical protein BU17DRAFT_96532 [Hysterangium stoloniferum]
MDLTSPLPFRHQREAFLPKPLEIPVTAAPLPYPESPLDMADEQPSPSPLSTPNYPFPPRSPLPPQKLASIANALGVNTPMPTMYRSPSPSGSSTFRSPSRFLLHIVPPPFLPSDDDDDGPDPEGTSEVSSTNYRSQFRRGTLIPLYPSLNSQLGAIAREYNLPSTGGLVLYLVHSSQNGAADGPRISDEIWKLLWHKALMAERQDAQPRSLPSLAFRSGRSTPASPFNHSNREFPHPFPPSRTPSSSFPYPSPLTSSAPSSEVHLPFSDKDDNGSNPDLAAIASDLTPNPFLPILAKVEFDIDRRKARWYNSWAQARHERSRWRIVPGGKLPLELSDRQSSHRHRFLATSDEERSEYTVLDDGDGEGEKTAVDDDDDPDQATVRLPPTDPLADVFGSDAKTWDQMHHSKSQNPELIIPSGDENLDLDVKTPDEDEVVKLWNDHQRPRLPIDSSPSHPRKGAPPPLTLATSSPESKASSGLIKAPGTGMLYFEGMSPSDSGSATSPSFGDKKTKRRTGIVFGDVQVKIVAEPDEMTESDRRSSQLVMKQQLDQLEKQLAQLSPRKLSSSPPPMPPMPDLKHDWTIRSAPPGVDKFNIQDSPSKPSKTSRPNASTPTAHHLDEPLLSPGPRVDSLAPLPVNKKSSQKQRHKRTQSSQSSSGSSSFKSQTSAIPHTLPLGTPPQIRHASQDRTPPQVTVQRASKNPVPVVSEETWARPQDEGRDIFVPSSITSSNDPFSPMMPLSPDPFGKPPVEDMRASRKSGEETRPPSRTNGTILPSFVPEEKVHNATSSRFSADSEHSLELAAKQRRARSNSIMSVRNLRNLWRKSNAPGKGNNTPPLPTEVAPPLPAPLPVSARPESQHSRTESFASQRSSMRPSMERTRRPSGSQHRPDSGFDPFQFDNANLYKSTSSPNLLNSNSGSPPPAANYAATSGSSGQSKGILKGWNGNANPNPPSDADARRKRHPGHGPGLGRRRSGSGTSASISERSNDLSTPPSSPRANARLSKHKISPSPSLETATAAVLLANANAMSSVSVTLPNASAIGLSRYPEAAVPGPRAAPTKALPATPPDGDEEPTPRSSDFDFELVSPPRMRTPSASYTGQISYS